jgi:hypothetical protein
MLCLKSAAKTFDYPASCRLAFRCQHYLDSTTQPFWDVWAEVMAAVDALPQAVRIGRGKPVGAATPKQVREMRELLERTHIFAGTTVG